MPERFEHTDIAVGRVAGLGAVLAGAVLVIAIGIAGFLHLLKGPPARPLHAEPPPPRLQVAPAAELNALRAREEEALTTYRWLDREKGVIAIPIVRAIELTVERNQPAKP